MVKSKKLNFLNPFVIAAVFCTVFIYSGLLKTKTKPVFSSMLKKEKIVQLEGKVVSNPVKSSTLDFYRAQFLPVKCTEKNGTISSCSGTTEILIPCEYAEAFLPGKIYTQSKGKGIICEAGTALKLQGNFSGKGSFVVKSAKQLKDPQSIRGKISAIRRKARINFRRLMFSWGEAGGLLLALLSGIREYTEDSVGEAFRKSGLSHILALSGMHLSLFSGIARFIGNKTLGKRLSCIFQVFAIIIFVWFAGVSPSLFRALLCSLMMIFCNFLSLKNISMLSILSASFLIHIMIRPEDIHQLAFMLSYGALAGILISGNMFSFFTIAKLPAIISNPLGASSGAQCFTAPVSLKNTGTFAPVGIISSVVVSPLINIFIYSGLLSILICLICPAAVPVTSFFMKILYNVIKHIVLGFSNVPYFEF